MSIKKTGMETSFEEELKFYRCEVSSQTLNDKTSSVAQPIISNQLFVQITDESKPDISQVLSKVSDFKNSSKETFY